MRNILISFLAYILKVQKKTIDFVLADDKKVGGLLLLFIPSIVISTLIYQISPLVIKFTLDILVNKDALKQYPVFQNSDIITSLVYLVVFAFILEFLDKIFNLINSFFSYKVKQISERQMEDKYFKTLSMHDLTFLSTDNNVRIIRNVGYIVSFIQTKIFLFISSIFSLPITIISLLVILPILHPYFFVLIALAAVINLLLNYYKSKKYRDWDFILTRNQNLRDGFRWILFYSFGKFYFNGILPSVLNKYEKVRQDVHDVEFKKDKENMILGFISEVTNIFIGYCILFLGAILVLFNIITIGTLALVNTYLARFNKLFSDISDLFSSIINLNLDLTRVEFILNLKPKLSDIVPLQQIPKRFSITMQNVYFKYPELHKEEKDYFEKLGEKVLDTKNTRILSRLERFIKKSFTSKNKTTRMEREFEQILSVFKNVTSANILEGVNLKLEKGVSYSLVGKNGAGKSTFVNLLKRGFEPSQGEILINNTNLRRMDRHEWKNQIASVEQSQIDIDGFLTVKEYLLISTDEEQKPLMGEKIEGLLKYFELDKLVSDLDLIIGEGIVLSGGQKQILGLIRILLSNKSLIILDEATNQLDAQNELKFVSIIKQYLPNSIVIFITHRMSTCVKADKIISLKGGKIEGIGTFEQMLSFDNEFKTLYEIQETVTIND